MLKRIEKLEVILLVSLLPIILLFPVFDGSFIYRASISDYAYSDIKSLFVMVLTLASTTLFINGCKDDVHTKNKWYAFVQGFLLLGVALTPHKDFPIIHYTCAGLFFLVNMFEMVVFSSPRFRWITFPLALIIFLALLGHFIGWYSMYWGEAFGLLPFITNIYLEIKNKID